MKKFTNLLIAGVLSFIPIKIMERNLQNHPFPKPKIEYEKTKPIPPWKNVAEYDLFVRSVVDANYQKVVKELYNFYNIKRELPKYGFKTDETALTCFDCAGAIYYEQSDSTYFYSTCTEDMLQRYINYPGNKNGNLKEALEKRIIEHKIPHEAAHGFYYDLGKQMNQTYLFKPSPKNDATSQEIILTYLIPDGVAEYMTYRGILNTSLDNDDLKKMIREKNDNELYELGFLLVKPILDKNFEKGVKTLIENPLAEKDLKNILKYQERILKKI